MTYLNSKMSGFNRPHEFTNFKVSKRCGFSERIHWFRVDGRPIRIKNICGFKNIRIRVDGACDSFHS